MTHSISETAAAGRSADERPLAGMSDAEIDDAVSGALLPPLLAALAAQTGERELLDFAEPASGFIDHLPAPQGGMSDEDQRIARERAAAAIRRLRDGESTDDEIPLPEIFAFLGRFVMWDTHGEVRTDLLERELGIRDFTPADDVKAHVAGLSAAVIGAGPTGLAAAEELLAAGMDVTVFERQSGVGGVWLRNRYPGVRLDTDNYGYTFSRFQRQVWDHYYSPGADMRGYLEEFAEHGAVTSRIRFDSTLKAAQWDAETAKWSVTIESGGERSTYVVDVLITAVGLLKEAQVPSIPGLGNFAGEIVHSMHWHPGVDPSQKSVAVIGTGASAFQVIPAIAPEAAHLTVFQRNAPWMMPAPLYTEPTSEQLRWLLTHVPDYYRWVRLYSVWNGWEGRREYARVDPTWNRPGSVSELNQKLRESLIRTIEEQYPDRPDLAQKVIPAYPPYAKRMLRDNGSWARTLHRDNVSLVTERIDRIEADGIRTVDGELHPVELIVLSTGFDTSDLLPGVDVVGIDGRVLSEYWSGEPRGYLCISVPKFPNFFILGGPNTGGVTNGTMHSLLSLSYVFDALTAARAHGYRAVAPTEHAYDTFNRRVDEANRLMAWGTDHVDNFYKSSSGRVSLIWPGSATDYADAIEQVDYTQTHEFTSPAPAGDPDEGKTR